MNYVQMTIGFFKTLGKTGITKLGSNTYKYYLKSTENRKRELIQKGYPENIIDDMINYETGLAIALSVMSTTAIDTGITLMFPMGGWIAFGANLTINLTMYKLYEQIARKFVESTYNEYLNDNFYDREYDKKNISSSLISLIYNSRDTDMPEDMINDLYDQYNGYRGKFHSAGDCECTPKDPIIFDLNNDGVLETTDINNGIYFDHENDGFAESSAWVGNNDGVLVIDNNSNEKIDNGTELLTAETLASFDTNEDGIIDENDTNFANLKILKSDGTLMTLTEAGITSINLNTTSTEITDENGNQQFASGTFTRADGTTGTFGEFLVKTETSNSIATEWLDETDEISDLPDISGRGNIYSLHQAMLRDESGELVA